LNVENFLHRVAADLWERYGNDLSQTTIVWPNNRSRIFFVDALSTVAGRAVWAPQYTSVDRLMEGLSGVGRADRIKAVTELYKVYSRYHSESFDSFYRWGEVLLNDFDTIDKYMIDADRLFANIYDIKELEDDLSYLTPEQIEVIKRFWGSFEGGRDEMSEYKKRFLSIWQTLGAIYHSFRENLAASGVAYGGRMYRLAAERLRDGTASLPEGRFVVVGFNALSETEKVLFDALKNSRGADFYWDYDDYYLKDAQQEAGIFVRENVVRYPAPASFSLPSTFASPKELTVVSTASDALQCKYAAEFIDEIIARDGSVDKRTAIVLTDENLLTPLLYSLPDRVGKVNITMGYPLRNTLAYSFTERLLLLQQRVRIRKDGSAAFYHSDVEGILSHPFVGAEAGDTASELKSTLALQGKIYIGIDKLTGHSALLDEIFCPVTDTAAMAGYICGVISLIARADISYETAEQRALRDECFGLIADNLTRTANSLAECGMEPTMKTYAALVRRVLQSVRIPYSGEPLSGIQIMGILETRNLDFDNVLILSMNDDNFPSGRINDVSFIPYNLRFAYGLPTPRHSEGVYAYYFYRLLQRASRVDMAYCSVSDDRSTGEQSRYIYQLDFESSHTLRRRDVALNVNLIPDRPIVVAKTGKVAERLGKYLDGGGCIISPSILNTYMECPLKFYFKALAGIKAADEITAEIDYSVFGTILHKAMYLLYLDLRRADSPQVSVAALINSPKVHEAVVRAITEDYFGGEEVPEEDYGGNLMMVRDTVEKYINGAVLPFDATRRNYRIEELEHWIKCDFRFGTHTVQFAGKADRIDRSVGDEVRIIDYKTGSLQCDFAGVAGLMSQMTSKRNGAALQTFLYAMMLSRSGYPNAGIVPSLYYVRYMNNSEYSPMLNDKTAAEEVADYGRYAEEFEAQLAEVLAGLFDFSTDFVQTDDRKSCNYCDFAEICRRG